MDNTKSQKIKLGLFVILGTILFVAAVYLIGQRQSMFNKTFTIRSYFQNVNGLQKGNNVRYAGIVIGTVKEIEMLSDTTIQVEMSIAENIVPYIKKDAVATIGSDGLVGSMIVNIVPGNGLAPVIVNGDIIKSYSNVSTDEVLNTLNAGSEKASILITDLIAITNKINNGAGTVGELVNDSILANDFKQSILSLRTVVNDLKIKDNSVLGVLLKDSISGTKLKSAIVNLETSSAKLEKTTGTLNNLVTAIDSSDGAFNYIVKDSTLVFELKSSIKNIEEGTVKFNENMEALKHNFLTRGYFRKLEKQEEKAKELENKK